MSQSWGKSTFVVFPSRVNCHPLSKSVAVDWALVPIHAQMTKERIAICFILFFIGLLSYDFYITECHAVAFGEAVRIETEDFGLDGLELDGLPDGVVDDV
jgi:hypothetical protein